VTHSDSDTPMIAQSKSSSEDASPTGPSTSQPSPRPRWRHVSARFGVLGVLMLLIAVFSTVRPHQFATGFNARTLLGDSATLIILATGLTFVVVSAGIDLSIGSVLVFASVVAAKAMVAMGGASAGWGVILVGLLIAAAAGMAWGAVNGFLVAKARIPPLIVTLGSFGAALGLAQVITQGLDVQTVPERLTSSIGTGLAFGAVPWVFVLGAAIAITLGLVLAYTRFGRHTYAIGSNPEAARRAGVNVGRHLWKIYALQGTLAGVAGWVSLARFAGTTISGHGTDNLDAIAAVAIGGTSLFGGVGWVPGSVVGVFIPAVLQNGFLIVGVQAYWQQVAVGAVLVAAVYVDQFRRRARAKA
jgi:ribose transport system permease protein